MKFFHWPLYDGSARYYLVGENLDIHSLEPELKDIDADWRDHIDGP